jgi:hypothetical protein
MTSPTARTRRNHKLEALGRVRAGLHCLDDGSASRVEIRAPQTGFYVQFVRTGPVIAGEAVGASHLPKLTVHRIGKTMQDVLPALGWRAPESSGKAGGNWSREWLADDWHAPEAADLVVSTFTDAFGIYAWALEVRTSSDIARR